MSKKEAEQLSDKELKNEWEAVKALMKNVPVGLSYMQSNMLFAHFVIISAEIAQRNL